MDYADQQRNPTKHLTGFAIVVGVHVLLGWMLLNGLTRKVVETIKAPPVEVAIIEEKIKLAPPPPPAPPAPPPPPRPKAMAPRPPPVVAPPEVEMTPPPQPAPAIVATPVVPPSAPLAPPAPPAPAPAPASPVVMEPRVNFETDCAIPPYPREARMERATGETRLRVSVNAEGRVTDVEVTRSAGPTRAHKQMDRAIVAAVRDTCRFVPGTVDGKPQPLTRDITYVWKLVD